MGGAENGKRGRGGDPKGERPGTGYGKHRERGAGGWGALGRGCREIGSSPGRGDHQGEAAGRWGAAKIPQGIQCRGGTGIWGAGSDWHPTQQQFQ